MAWLWCRSGIRENSEGARVGRDWDARNSHEFRYNAQHEILTNSAQRTARNSHEFRDYAQSLRAIHRRTAESVNAFPRWRFGLVLCRLLLSLRQPVNVRQDFGDAFVQFDRYRLAHFDHPVKALRHALFLAHRNSVSPAHPPN